MSNDVLAVLVIWTVYACICKASIYRAFLVPVCIRETLVQLRLNATAVSDG